MDCEAETGSSSESLSSSSSREMNLSEYSEFMLFASEALHVGDRSSVYTGTGAIGSNDYVEIGADASSFSDVISGGTIWMRERASVDGDLIFSNELQTQSQYTVSGNIYQQELVDVQYPGISVHIGSDNINIEPYSQDYIIEPGEYGRLEVKAGSNIILRSGNYSFRDFYLHPDVEVQFDNSEGPINIDVLYELRIADRTKMVFLGRNNPLDIFFNVASSLPVVIGTDADVYGQIYAPNANIDVFSRSAIRGKLFGKKITMQPDVRVCEPPMLAGLSYSDVAYGPAFNPLVTQYHGVVSTDVQSLSFDALVSSDVVATIGDQGALSEEYEINEGENTFYIRLYSPERDAFLHGCGESYYEFKAVSTPEYVIYVNDDASCEECDGSSWDNALKNLPDAIGLARNQGKEIRVAEGTYTPSGNERTTSFYLTPGMEIYGGFKGENYETLDNRRGEVSETVLSGDLNGNDWEGIQDDNSYHVVSFVGGNLTNSYVLSGFTIQNGVADGANTYSLGGGLYIENASPVLEKVVVTNNWASGNGAGLYANASKNLSMSNSYVYDNSTTGSGGAFYLTNVDLATISNVVIQGNNSLYPGAAFFAENSNIVLQYATVVANTALNNPAWLLSSSNLHALNVVSWNNSYNISDLNPFLLQNGSVEQWTNSWRERVDVLDPMFSSIDLLGEDKHAFSLDDGFGLVDGSPLIDKGVFIADITHDIIGVERIVAYSESAASPDIGAREWFPSISNSIAFYEIWNSGEYVLAEEPKYLSGDLPDYYPVRLKKSTSAYSLSILLPPNEYLEDSFKADVQIKDENGNICSENKRFTFKKINTVDGMNQYVTATDTWGRKVFLSTREMPSYDGYHVLKICADETFVVHGTLVLE
jgi:hypothetical protein